MRKVVLWYFFTSESSEKNHNSTFPIQNLSIECIFSKSDGKVGVISWLNSTLTQKVELWIFTLVLLREKIPQNNFSHQNFSVENNYYSLELTIIVYIKG